MRKSDYRPKLINLEDRVAPGTTLANALDPSMLLTLGSSLSALDRDLLNTSSENRVADLGQSTFESPSLADPQVPVQTPANQTLGIPGTAGMALAGTNMLDTSHLLQMQQSF